MLQAAGRTLSPLLQQLPNLLSLARLAVAPLTVMMILDGRFTAAFWLFVAAAVTDAVDGILARWLDARTVIGTFLDPAADKLLLVGTFLSLAWLGGIPAWVVGLIVLRDIGLVLGLVVMWMVGHPFRTIAPSRISKLNTVLQIALAVAALALPGLALDAGWVLDGLVWAVAASTIASGAGYLWIGLRRIMTFRAHA